MLRSSSARSVMHADPDRPAAVSSCAVRRGSDRGPVDVDAVAAATAVGPAPEDALHRVRHDDRRLNCAMSSSDALRILLATAGTQPTFRQGAKAFSTPSSAGASSGWWRISTSTIVVFSTQRRPSGV